MKLTTAELKLAFAEARLTTPEGSRWKHKKGGTYIVSGHALDTDTGLIRVSYRRIAGPDFDAAAERYFYYSRPIGEWAPDRFTEITG